MYLYVKEMSDILRRERLLGYALQVPDYAPRAKYASTFLHNCVAHLIRPVRHRHINLRNCVFVQRRDLKGVLDINDYKKICWADCHSHKIHKYRTLALMIVYFHLAKSTP